MSIYHEGVHDTDGDPELRISLHIFEKLNNCFTITKGLDEDDSWNKPEVKKLMTLSF